MKKKFHEDLQDPKVLTTIFMMTMQKLLDGGMTKEDASLKAAVKSGVKVHKGGKVTSETSETQSKNPNVASSRFDGTKSAKNIYQKSTPGQPVTEDASDLQQPSYDRAKILDALTQANQAAQAAQNPQQKTSASQASDRRQFNQQGEVKTMTGPSGEKYSTTVSNQGLARPHRGDHR